MFKNRRADRLSGRLLYRPPLLDRLVAGSQVLFWRADAFEEGEGLLGEQRSFAVARGPRVLPFLRVVAEVVELGLIVGAAQDEGALLGAHGERHVVVDPARLGVHGRDDLTLREIQRPGTDDERPVLLPAPLEHTAEGVAGHGRGHTT